MRRWQSGQMHGTVNPATIVYGGSNPSRRTKINRFDTRYRGGIVFCAGRDSKRGFCEAVIFCEKNNVEAGGVETMRRKTDDTTFLWKSGVILVVVHRGDRISRRTKKNKTPIEVFYFCSVVKITNT